MSRMNRKKKPLVNKYVKILGLFSGLILAVSVTVAILNIRDTNNTFREYESSTMLINKCEDVISIIKDAETGQRGYIITGDQRFLESYKSAQTYVEDEVSQLSELMKQNHIDNKIIDSLKTLVSRKIRGTIRTKIYVEELNFVTNDSLKKRLIKGKATMDKIRSIIGNIKKGEQRRFEQKKTEANQKTTASVYIIIVTTAVSFLIFVVLLFNLNKTVRVQLETEKLLLQSQRSLEQQVYKLNLSNNELEQFAYVASHDLQEPLRKIISFNERIQDKLKDNDEIKPFLERMSNSATRMRTLIQDLLNFSHATKPVDTNEDINLEHLFNNILEDLESTIFAARAMVKIGPMPVIKGNNTQIRQLFQNLVSNAIKFSREGVSPVITISSQKAASQDLLVKSVKDFHPKFPYYMVVKVTDNGIGFEEQYAEQIFVIFKRLHGRSEFEGTGIGLSVVKKIIENHEGFIIAEGRPNQGATFTVGLPYK